MKTTIAKFMFPAAVLAAGLMVTQMQSFGTVAISKKEGNAKCTTCHVAAGKKDLNDTGTCYKGSKDLKACAKK